MTERYLIAGLGNPGKEYANTRHNIGFRCVDALAETCGMTFDKGQGKARVASGIIEGRPVLLVKPQTFMNRSGESISALAAFYKIPPERILIIFDDMDLPIGTLRIRKQGGSSGQKGMRHIIQTLSTQEITRIRFGIGRPPGRMDPAAYVLRPFHDGDEAILVSETIDRVIKAIRVWITDGIDKVMNLYNGSAEEVYQRQLAATASHENTRQSLSPPPNDHTPSETTSKQQLDIPESGEPPHNR
jgi:PTH1 family peptidyl-tRNA hydrolase